MTSVTARCARKVSIAEFGVISETGIRVFMHQYGIIITVSEESEHLEYTRIDLFFEVNHLFDYGGSEHWKIQH